MPEGDTVHKLARALRPRLEGRALSGLWLRDRGWVRPLRGARVEEVAALGKHFLFCLDAEGRRFVVHVHLGMRGRWHVYPNEATWPAWVREPVVRLETDRHSFVCFRAAVAELLRRGEVPLHPALARLGPDLLGPQVDYAEILRRARRREPRSVAELLLDQRVACGIGNEYKSEILFLEGIHPRTPVARIPDAALERLYRRARGLLARNLGGWRRTTTRRMAPGAPDAPALRLWVYGRAGDPCRVCSGTIRSARVGDDARPTWWCTRCQPEMAA